MACGFVPLAYLVKTGMFITVSPDLPPRLTEHVHHLLGVTAGLFVIRTVLLSIFYYLVFRRRLGHKLFQLLRRGMYRVFGRTSAKATGGGLLRAEAGSIITIALLLMLPLALAVLFERYLFRVEKNYILEGILHLNEVDRLIRDDFPSIFEVLTVTTAPVVFWVFDYFHELRALSRKRGSGRRRPGVAKRSICSKVWAVRPCGDVVKYRGKTLRVRRRLSSRMWYYLLFNVMLVTVMFTLVSALTSRKNRMQTTVSVTAMGESPLRARIQSLAEKAGVGTVAVNVAHVSRQTSAMSASGVYWMFGPRITIYDTTLECLSENGLLFVTAHELYHVKQIPGYVVIVTSSVIITVILLIVFGPPRRRRYAKPGEVTADELTKQFTLMVPRYLCIGVVAWLIFQGVSCALRRGHEAEADRFAVRLTRGGATSLDDARTALTKINESGLNDPSPPYLFQMLFNDHPSLRERLRNIEAAR